MKRNAPLPNTSGLETRVSRVLSLLKDESRLHTGPPHLPEVGCRKTWGPGKGWIRFFEADVQVSLFPEYNTLDRRPRAGERQFPVPSTVN
jgi:hypothetical protein